MTTPDIRSNTPRLRTINGAAQELKQLDPSTAVSAAAIRRLVRQGCIPCIYSGTRAYINYDKLLEYLENPVPPVKAQPATVCGIRPVDEQCAGVK